MFPRLAFVLVTLSAARAQYPQCGSDQKGITSPYPVQLRSQGMDPGYSAYRVSIEPYMVVEACGPNNKEVALLVQACDHDYAPTVQVVSLTEANVYRNGDLTQQGNIYTTLFCAKQPYTSQPKDVQGPVVHVEPAQNAVYVLRSSVG